MKVCTLITIPNPEAFTNCTLVLPTLRTGFPEAHIEVWLNYPSDMDKMREVIGDESIKLRGCNSCVHHAEWIEQRIRDTIGELIIIDPDLILWKEWTWKFNTLLAGMYVPKMWNEFAQCISFERLHTSFLQIRDCKQLIQDIEQAYPMGVRCPEYAPLNPFMPRVEFISGTPYFWDSTSCLYNILGGTAFGPEQLDCYDHLNSASFLDIMAENMENGAGFREAHKLIASNPQLLKGVNLIAQRYYKEMKQKAEELEQ